MIFLRTILAFLTGAIGLIVTLLVAVALVPLWLVSSLTARIATLLEPSAIGHGDVVEYDPHLGWRGKANQHVYVRDEGGEPRLVTTDQQGWRGSTTVSESDVVVFGDSFAFGDGIGDREFFANIPGTRRVKAIGTPGYSMVQGLLLMERLQDGLANKTVVWLIYHGNDLADNLRPEMDGYRTPFARRSSEGWSVHSDHVSADRWTFPTRFRAHELLMEIGSESFLTERAFSAVEFLVCQARDVLAQVGARLVVWSVPDLSALSQARFEDAARTRPDLQDWDSGLADRELEALCKRSRVDFLSLADHLTGSDYRTADVHWNEDGNIKVAGLLQSMRLEDPDDEESAPAVQPTAGRA